jgi:hypothetical protein
MGANSIYIVGSASEKSKRNRFNTERYFLVPILIEHLRLSAIGCGYAGETINPYNVFRIGAVSAHII